MRKYNGKQLGLMAACFVAAFVVNWGLWLLFMKHPEEINVVYQALLTLLLASVFIIVADRFAKTKIFG